MVSPVHVLMLSILAVRGLPRQRPPGIVPCSLFLALSLVTCPSLPACTTTDFSSLHKFCTLIRTSYLLRFFTVYF